MYNVHSLIRSLHLRTNTLTKTTAVQNDDALSYIRVRELYYLAVVFVTTIFTIITRANVTNLRMLEFAQCI